jgi:hypothetical protein
VSSSGALTLLFLLLIAESTINLSAPVRWLYMDLSLRVKAFEISNDIKSRVDKAWKFVVSCVDVTALAKSLSGR